MAIIGETGALRPGALVFLGPSLSRAEAEDILAAVPGAAPATIEPSIRRGDLDRLAGDTPRDIAIVDGVFHQALAVSPNEVRRTLAAGHSVFGASSMGALRAAELGLFGMVGVGEVYAAYARGDVERDDEVAVTFDPETGRALSLPLIGLRAALADAVAHGVLDPAEAVAVEADADRRHYRERTWRVVLGVLDLDPDRHAAVLAFLRDEAVDRKGDDARALLRLLAERTRAGGDTSGPDATGAEAPTGPEARVTIGPRPLSPRTALAVGGLTLDALPAAPKRPGFTSVRTVDADATAAVLAEIGPRVGITRVAEVTGLDTVGIPSFTAIAPGVGVSAYSGKSLERAQARVGAQMEALEAAMHCDARVPMRRATARALATELAGSARVLSPERLPVVAAAPADLDDVELDWVPGWDLRTGTTVWVPADAVFFRPGPLPPFERSSNGLASGNVLVEAVTHALAELLERDALTLQALATEYAHLPTLLAHRAGPARPCWPRRLPVSVRAGLDAVLDPSAHPFVDLTTLPAPLRAAVDQVRAAGAELDLRVVGTPTGLATFLCRIHQDEGPSLVLTHLGSGTHPDAEVAARRAITEAAQSRVGYIQGVREDLVLPAVRDARPHEGGWFGSDPDAPRVTFDAVPSHRHADVADDLRHLVAAAGRAGLDEVVVVDLSHPEVPLPVVKVFVPGIEVPLEPNDPSRFALGPRGRAVLDLLAERRARLAAPRPAAAPVRIPVGTWS